MPYTNKGDALAAGRRAYAKQMQDSSKKEARAKKAAAYMRAYYATNPTYRAKAHEYRERWRLANRDYYHFRVVLAKYGLTLDQYHAKLEAQDFCCAICCDDGELMVDHHHGTGRPRGLLCRNCNTAIGMLRESPQLFVQASEYVSRWI